MTTNLINASITTPGRSVTRTLGARFGDVVNVLDFGADNTGNHTNNNVTAITNALAAQGLIYFPPGEYWLNSSVSLPYTATSTSGEGYTCFGYGAFIHGNFADWLFQRPFGFDNNQIKGFHGFAFENEHAAGGCLYWANATDNVVEDCLFLCDGMGVAGWDGNGPLSAIRCKFLSTGNIGTPPNSVGITFANNGGIINGCDFTSLDRAVVICSSNNTVLSNRFEVSNWGITIASPSFQVILSTASGSGGAATILNLSNTLMYNIPGTTIGVNIDSFSGSGGYNVTGHYTATRLNATQLSVPKAYSPDTLNGDVYLTIEFLNGIAPQGANSGGNGITISSDSFEGCTIGVMCRPTALIGTIQNCNFLLDQHTSLSFTGGAPNGWSRCAVMMGNNMQAFVIQGCTVSGLCTLGGIYFGGAGGNGPYNNVIQANTFGPFPPTSQALQTGIVNGAQTGVTNLLLFEMPRWLVFPVADPALTGPLKLLSISGVAPTPGTTVTGTSGTTITLSHAVTAADGAALIFTDSSSSLGGAHTDLPVGLVSLL